MNWKYASFAHEEFEELVRYVGAYASASIDKATHIKEFIKEKEERIWQLEQ